jgi:hypothetical protein
MSRKGANTAIALIVNRKEIDACPEIFLLVFLNRFLNSKLSGHNNPVRTIDNGKIAFFSNSLQVNNQDISAKERTSSAVITTVFQTSGADIPSATISRTAGIAWPLCLRILLDKLRAVSESLLE